MGTDRDELDAASGVPQSAHGAAGATTPAHGSTGRATIRDVARRAGVSVTTVSRVLGHESDRVKGVTRAAVMAAVSELDYVVNAHARALAGRGSKTVAFLVSEMVGPSFSLLAGGVEQVSSDLGYLFMMCTTHGDAAREQELVDLMREQRAAAVLLVGAALGGWEYEARIANYARELSLVGSKLVLCGRPPIASRPDVTSVDYDNFGGGYAITQHLLQLGHRRILFLGALPGHSTSAGRLDGYRAALADAGIEPDPRLAPLGAADYSPQSAQAVVERALDGEPAFTAIVGVTDFVAVGALRALRARGIPVPEQMSVTGFDDTPLVGDLTPALTTVHVPFEELGRETARLALAADGATAYKHVVLPVNISVRESTAPPPA